MTGDTRIPDDMVRFDAGDGAGPVSRLLRARALTPHFQPIAQLRDGSVHAHEALIRGPAGMPLRSPDALLAAAGREHLLLDFEIASLVITLEHWAGLREPGRLFVNVSASALTEIVENRASARIDEIVRSLGIPPRMLVLEITEHERVTDLPALLRVVGEVHAAGVALALDDFGDGRSSLRLWSEVKPEIVKIDKYFTKELSRHADKLQTLRALMQIAEIFGTALVAEGIETADDLRVLRDLGIAYGQGYFLGRPAEIARRRIEPAAAAVLEDSRVAVFPEMRRPAGADATPALSVVQAPYVKPTTTNSQVAELFAQRIDLHAVAVVEADMRPVGLINRQQFMERYGKLYFKEIHGRQPCISIANADPRLIERVHKVDELLGILTSQDQRYLADGFIVTDNGRYAGLGSGEQLVRAVTEARIESARHANPLTLLPGNIPRSEHMERLLAGGGRFIACYADLNNFKPFNDHYGYWRGDEMIRLVARICLANCDPQRDFLGHVGGDDFFILFQSSDWVDRCERIVFQFNHEAQALFDEPARALGGIDAEDRDGTMRFFACTTLSIGAVPVEPGQFRRSEQVANEAALAKHHAKRSNTGLLVRPPMAASVIAREPGSAEAIEPQGRACRQQR